MTKQSTNTYGLFHVTFKCFSLQITKGNTPIIHIREVMGNVAQSASCITCASWNKLAKVYSETSLAMVLARPEYVAHRVELTDPMSEELPSTTALSNFIKHASVVVLFIQLFFFSPLDGRPVISRTYNVCTLKNEIFWPSVVASFLFCNRMQKCHANLVIVKMTKLCKIMYFVYYYEDNL